MVLGDIPSLRENWEGRAIFVRPDDEDGLTEAVERLVANPKLRERMGRCAREHALTFSTKRCARGYTALYKEMVKEAKRPVMASANAGPGLIPASGGVA